jgi:hypothetical protein
VHINMATKSYNEFVMQLRFSVPLCAVKKILPVKPLEYRFDGDRLIVHWLCLDGTTRVLDTNFGYRVSHTKIDSNRLGKETFIQFPDIDPINNPTTFIRNLLFHEIEKFDFRKVTIFSFRNAFSNIMEVVIKNQNEDWSFLHPWADYRVQEIRPRWPEKERLDLEADYGPGAVEEYREHMLHRRGFKIIAEEHRHNLPLEEIIPWITSNIGPLNSDKEDSFLKINSQGHAYFPQDKYYKYIKK